jgi:hypothetical protein
MRFPALFLVLLLAACGDDDDTSAPPDDTGARTLASCSTSIAAEAPEFFRTHFRCVTITASADAVTIASEGLPPHPSYYYGEGDPNYAPFDTSRGEDYRPNPNVLVAADLAVTIPLAPVAKGLTIAAADVDGVVGTSDEEYGLGPVGVAIDSVALFNPLAAPGDDIEAERFTFDDYDAHPAPNGVYHYHTASKGPLEVMVALALATTSTPGDAERELFGVMCDGTVVLGCTELDGSAPAGTLDAQGGHVHDLGDGAAVLLADRYHTHVCPSDATGRRFTPEIQYYDSCTR